MRIMKDHIPISNKKRPGSKSKKLGFTIHSTANCKSTARNERDYLTNPHNANYSSFNFVVDEKEIIECIPWDEVSYHAGNTRANWHTISIEMCENGNIDKVISNTIDLIIEINKKYKIALNLYRHYDWPMKEKGYTYKKDCPRILNYDNWQGWRDFILLLKYRLEEGKMDEKRVRDLVRDELNRLSRSQDIPKWAEKAIDYVRDKKLMIGDIGENFSPNSLVSRAELAQTIYNLREQR